MKQNFIGAASILMLVFGAAAPFTLAGERDEEPKIVTAMEQMNRDLRKLRRQAGDAAQKEANLALIGSALASARTARDERPLMVEEGLVAEADRDAFLQGYHKAMDRLIATLEKLETALQEGQAEEAEALIKRVYQAKREGHRRYQKEEEH